MSFRGSNPKMIARDIAKGNILLTLANIRKYNQAQLKIINQNLTIVEREYRTEHYEPEQVEEIKRKHMCLQRLYRARTLIQTYAKKWKIQI